MAKRKRFPHKNKIASLPHCFGEHAHDRIDIKRAFDAAAIEEKCRRCGDAVRETFFFGGGDACANFGVFHQRTELFGIHAKFLTPDGDFGKREGIKVFVGFDEVWPCLSELRGSLDRERRRRGVCVRLDREIPQVDGDLVFERRLFERLDEKRHMARAIGAAAAQIDAQNDLGFGIAPDMFGQHLDRIDFCRRIHRVFALFGGIFDIFQRIAFFCEPADFIGQKRRCATGMIGIFEACRNRIGAAAIALD